MIGATVGGMDSAAEPTAAPTVAFDEASSRLDGFRSLIKGLGIFGRDAVQRERPLMAVLTDEDLEQAYRGDAIAARIVDLLPDEAMREGWTVRVDEMEGQGEPDDPGLDALPYPTAPPKPRPKGSEGDPAVDPNATDVSPAEANEIADAMTKYLRKLGAPTKTKRGLSLGRLFGGALLIGGFSDATSLEQLAGERKPGVELRWLILVDRRVAQCGPLEDDPSKPNFGEPKSYEVTLLNGTKTVQVHASRVIRFPGRWAPQKFANEAGESGRRDPRQLGWDDSVLLGVWDPLRHFSVIHEYCARVARDFSRGVYKIKNFHDLLAGNREDLVRMRFQLVEECQSVLNAMLLDADSEAFELMQRPIAGLPDLMDRYGVLLAASCGYTISRLLGVAPGGFASGEDDARLFDNVALAYRDDPVRCILEQLCTWAFEDPKGPTQGKVPSAWSINFPQLRMPSEKERAEIRNLIALAWKACVDSGILLPDEAAEGMFGKADGFGLDVVLDRDAREEAKQLEADQHEAEIEAMLAAAKNPPPAGAPPRPGAPKPAPAPPKPTPGG